MDFKASTLERIETMRGILDLLAREVEATTDVSFMDDAAEMDDFLGGIEDQVAAIRDAMETEEERVG